MDHSYYFNGLNIKLSDNYHFDPLLFNTKVCLVKISADIIVSPVLRMLSTERLRHDVLFNIPRKKALIFPKETICMKYQTLFSEKSKKNIVSLSSAKFAHRVIMINLIMTILEYIHSLH